MVPDLDEYLVKIYRDLAYKYDLLEINKLYMR